MKVVIGVVYESGNTGYFNFEHVLVKDVKDATVFKNLSFAEDTINRLKPLSKEGIHSVIFEAESFQKSNEKV